MVDPIQSYSNACMQVTNLSLDHIIGNNRLSNMPISPTYEWEQTEVGLEVRVALPSASRNQRDVFATECLLKVNATPYLLVLDLWGEVDDARSAATLTHNGVNFKLYKVSCFWSLSRARPPISTIN